MGKHLFFGAIARFDELHPQPDDESALLQLQILTIWKKQAWTSMET
jgi:hypothetical protein